MNLSHKCSLEDDDKYLVIESLEDGWKHVLVRVEFEFEDEKEHGEKEHQIAYACCKRYELKYKREPPSYNQAPPGLYARYPYLYKVRISHETWLELTKLYCQQIITRKES